MNYWLLLEKSDETRVSKGIDGYRDSTGESYHYDSLVPNYRKVSAGDAVIFRKESEIIGTGSIKSINVTNETKTHRRCPDCGSTDIRERAKKNPKWKCGKCAAEFPVPNETKVKIRSYVASIKDYTKLDALPSVKAVKQCALSGKGESSQLSMLRLDPFKLQTLFEGVNPVESAHAQANETSGQGFGLSQAERRAVELRAMRLARVLYEESGWKVIDKSSSCPYDFLATKEGSQKFIEVKGTTGKGHSVILTHGEVSHIRDNTEQSVLVVVSGIQLEMIDGKWEAHGGSITTHEDPWVLIDVNLNATQYRYAVK